MDWSPGPQVAMCSCVTLGKALPFSESSPWNRSDIRARQVFSQRWGLKPVTRGTSQARVPGSR